MIYFSTPTTLDLRAITTMGVSVKLGDNPIGQFGTGLKYAIAVLLRTGHGVFLKTGGKSYSFSTAPTLIRGKEFSLVTMQEEGQSPRELPFTTDYGSGWEVWMTYRELVCNTKDEGGEWGDHPSNLTGMSGDSTTISVSGFALAECFRSHDKYFLKPNLLAEIDGMEIHYGASSHIFYRGIRAGDLEKPAIFTYNRVRQAKLTEDRTLDSMYGIFSGLASSLCASSHSYILEKVLTSPEGSLETTFSLSSWEYSPTFVKETKKALATNRLTNRYAAESVRRHIEATEPPKTLHKLTPKHETLLSRATSFLNSSETPITHQIEVVESLPHGALGIAKEGRIWLALCAFEGGLKQLVITLLEEELHLRSGANDCTRAFQEAILSCALREMEKSQKEWL